MTNSVIVACNKNQYPRVRQRFPTCFHVFSSTCLLYDTTRFHVFGGDSEPVYTSFHQTCLLHGTRRFATSQLPTRKRSFRTGPYGQQYCLLGAVALKSLPNIKTVQPRNPQAQYTAQIPPTAMPRYALSSRNPKKPSKHIPAYATVEPRDPRT